MYILITEKTLFSNVLLWIRIRIALKCRILIRIEVNPDLQPWLAVWISKIMAYCICSVWPFWQRSEPEPNHGKTPALPKWCDFLQLWLLLEYLSGNNSVMIYRYFQNLQITKCRCLSDQLIYSFWNIFGCPQMRRNLKKHFSPEKKNIQYSTCTAYEFLQL
jgi:hypothetical protein